MSNPSNKQLPESEQHHNIFVVGIGASAGGLRALEEFFENMPTDSGATFVVIQHLSPDFKSLMKELLERRTRMAIYRVTEGMSLEPNSIYLIPPGKNLVLENRKLHLLEQEERNRHGLNFPIDIFLESLAQNYGERAIGVILSGTGSDGTNGLRAINEAGGFAMAQDPSTAEFDGMPRTAIATGVVDQILSPEELAQFIYQLTRSPLKITELAQNQVNSLNNYNLQRIASILAKYEQIDFSHYKTSTLSRRINRRFLISGCNNLEDYINLLENSPGERATLRHDLLISVTKFFRDRHAWDFLENYVIPNTIERAKPGEELRFWVTACATGEEAYSLAILLDEAAEKLNQSLRFKIFATDIDKVALEKATQGIYSENITNDIGFERLERYFIKKDKSFQVIRKLREKILFAPHDLTKDAGFTRMNLISCRNVLIYLQPELQQQVLRNLHFSLLSKGNLFLGEAETLGNIEEEFKPIYKKGKIYQKRRDVRLPVPVKGVHKIERSLVPLLPHKDKQESRLEPILDKAFSAFLGKYQATCLLVDRENKLFHVFNDAIEVLKLFQGRTTTDITKLIVPDLQLPLVTALHRAKREKISVSYTGIKLNRNRGVKSVKLEVSYHESNKLADDFFMIFIQEDGVSEQPSGERFEADAEASQRIMELEYELQQTRENLQAVIEELETTNEEQQATNEELTASNEELQSTNEELHSVNEELYTVNAEYQSKIEELTELNNDIDNLLRSTDIGVVFLDRDLKIRKFTPAATVAINLLAADIDRPLEHITHNLNCDNLIELLHQVIETQEVVDREVKLVKRDFYLLMRINPYLQEDGRLDGVVITFIDIDELKAAQEQVHLINQDLKQSQLQLRQLNQELEQRVEERAKALKQSEIRLRAILETTTSLIYLKFNYEVLSSLPSFIHCDETRLRQVLLNLLSNGIKFTDQGHLTFKVGFVEDFSQEAQSLPMGESTTSSKIRFEVEDTGIGIPHDKLEDIFLPFHQLENSPSSQEGTGLGLSISQNIVGEMDSQIFVSSVLGEGSTFWFDLDLQEIESKNQIQDIPYKPDVIGYKGNKRTILIVDDLANNRSFLVNLLQSLGFNILEASNGLDAIALARENKPDLIILDLIMPEMDGWEATKIIRQDTTIKDVIIIIVSASTLPTTESSSREVGANGFLAKPLNFDNLLNILSQYLELEWVYQENNPLIANNQTTTSESVLESNSGFITPNQEQLNRLLDLASQGDIREVLSQTILLEANSELIPFAKKLRQLAETCQMKKLKQFLHQYTNPK